MPPGVLEPVVLGFHEVVVNRKLPGVAGNGHRQPAARVDVAEQHLGDRPAALFAADPGFDHGRDVVGHIPRRQRPPVHEDDDGGCAGLRDRPDELLLEARELERRGIEPLADGA